MNVDIIFAFLLNFLINSIFFTFLFFRFGSIGKIDGIIRVDDSNSDKTTLFFDLLSEPSDILKNGKAIFKVIK